MDDWLRRKHSSIKAANDDESSCACDKSSCRGAKTDGAAMKARRTRAFGLDLGWSGGASASLLQARARARAKRACEAVNNDQRHPTVVRSISILYPPFKC